MRAVSRNVLCLAVVLACLAAALASPLPGVTPEQYEKSMKMLRNVCVPKTGVTDEIIQRLKNGELVEDQKAFCYTACVMTTIMALKNNKVDGKMFKSQVKKMMQEAEAERVIAAFEACKETPSGAEPCETTELFLKCVKKVDPGFVIPA